MNTILEQSHHKGRSAYALSEAVECVKCGTMAFFVVNSTSTGGQTVCLHCGGEHEQR